MVRQISFAILVLAWVGLYPAAYADFRIVPGMTVRTNSPACLAKYQEVYNLAGAYFNGVPAISTLKRVDVLAGGLAFDNATSSPLAGKQKTQLYAVSSTYGSVPTGNVDGYMELQNGYDRFEVGTYSNVRVKLGDGGILRMSAAHDLCATGEKSPDLSVDYSNYVSISGLGPFYLSFNVAFASKYSTGVCGDTARKISDILADAKTINSGNGVPKLMNTSTFPNTEIPYTDIDTEAKRASLALSLAQANKNLNNYYSSLAGAVYCGFSYYDPSLGELPTDSNVEKYRKRNLQALNNFVRNRQCYFEIDSFVDRILTSGILKSTTFATACSKAK
jgi:hypothetical protein